MTITVTLTAIETPPMMSPTNSPSDKLLSFESFAKLDTTVDKTG